MPAIAVNPSDVAIALLPFLRERSPLPWRLHSDGSVSCVVDANGAFAHYMDNPGDTEIMERVNEGRMDGLTVEQLYWLVRTAVVDSDKGEFNNRRFSWSIESADGGHVRVVSSNVGIIADRLTLPQAFHLLGVGQRIFARMGAGFDH